MTTTEMSPSLQEALGSLPEPVGLAKIIIQTLRDERGALAGVAFARADSGMIIGAAKAGATQFGHGPIDTKYFISQTHAVEYVKELCRTYLDRGDVDFLSQEGDVPLILAGNGNPGQRRRM
jgi:hypothetical protein